jgi:hypothetical protein
MNPALAHNIGDALLQLSFSRFLLVAVLVLSGCGGGGGGTPLFTLGGTVSGHLSPLVLRMDGQSVNVPAVQCVTAPCVYNFEFGIALATGTAYHISVQTQPAGQTCTVSNASGTMPAMNVNSVEVSCIAQSSFALGGFVFGLTTNGLVLAAAGQTVAVNPPEMQFQIYPSPPLSFSFPAGLLAGTDYGVTVQAQPSGKTCSVGQGVGTMPAANVSSVEVSCVSTATPTVQ